MRIIAGEYKGRKLSPIPGLLIRPTADRIRESIFNIIGTHASNAIVLDLFAGTGALGLEALSRGAAVAFFVDNSKTALSVVKKSVGMIGVDGRAQIIRWDIAKDLNCIRGSGRRDPGWISDGEGGTARSGFDLVFIDPPYNRNLVGKALAHLSSGDVLSKDAVIVVEHSHSEQLPEDGSGYCIADQRTYGRTCVSFLRMTV